jgi:hypothetical protein
MKFQNLFIYITKVKIPPKPDSKLYLPALAQIVSNAFLAAVQKLSPVKAIYIKIQIYIINTYIYAFLLRNSINRSKHANIQEM